MIGGLLWLALTAHGGEALTFDAERVVTHGTKAPSVSFHPGVSGELSVALTCAGRTWHLQTEISPGQDVVLSLDGLPEGAHHCTGEIGLKAADGSQGQMPLTLDVASLPMMKLASTLEQLQLEQRTLTVTSSRPVTQARVTVIGPRGALLAEADADLTDPSAPRFAWQGEGEVVKLEVEARDAHGFRSVLTLSPWQYQIPHEDVVFASGSDVITEVEASKLETSWAEIGRVLGLYGDVVEIELYVGGYTDTVGTAANNQALSDRRARAIGRWFRKRGFTRPIHFQGFGESALAVATADETAEPANRRSLYVLAAQVPPVSEHLPATAWKRL